MQMYTHFHAEVVERGRWCEPLRLLALEACVDSLEEPLDIIFVSINEAVVHIEADGEVPFRVPENAPFIFSTDEALLRLFKPRRDGVLPPHCR